MDDQERVAIQNVVKGRQPKLIQLEAKNSGVGEQDGASKTATGASVTKLASPSKDPKKRKCPDCDFTYVADTAEQTCTGLLEEKGHRIAQNQEME